MTTSKKQRAKMTKSKKQRAKMNKSKKHRGMRQARPSIAECRDETVKLIWKGNSYVIEQCKNQRSGTGTWYSDLMGLQNQYYTALSVLECFPKAFSCNHLKTVQHATLGCTECRDTKLAVIAMAKDFLGVATDADKKQTFISEYFTKEMKEQSS